MEKRYSDLMIWPMAPGDGPADMGGNIYTWANPRNFVLTWHPDVLEHFDVEEPTFAYPHMTVMVSRKTTSQLPNDAYLRPGCLFECDTDETTHKNPIANNMFTLEYLTVEQEEAMAIRSQLAPSDS